MGLDNLFYILIALDALTALAVMLICIDNPGVYENTVAGIKYLVFSAVTSVLAYLGAILVL